MFVVEFIYLFTELNFQFILHDDRYISSA